MFRKHKYQAEYLVQWNARLSNDITEPLVDKVVEAVLHYQHIPFEHTSEYRNLYSYEKLWEQLEHYESEQIPSVASRHIKAGLSRSFKNFALPKFENKLQPVKLNAAAGELITQLGLRDTSSGLTAYGASKFEAFGTGLDKAVKIMCDGKAPSPCLAGVRTQRKEKTRLVWGYPLEMTIIEATVARPIIDYFKGMDHLMSFGKTSHELGMRLRKSCSTTKYHTSIDYSQFDSSVHPEMIKYAFNAFRTWFDLSDVVYGDVTVGQVFDIVERYFISTPIVMPSRETKYPTLVLGKRVGVPSGSYFTQLVDSFVNAALIFAVSDRFQLSVKEENIYVLGDDCLFFANQEIDLCTLSNFVSTFGYKCNPAKGSSGLANQCIEYLGRTWRNGFPIREYSEIVRGALYPEKYRKYSEAAGQRQMEALNVLNSYLLTSYVEDAPVGTQDFGNVVTVTDNSASGFTQYLLREGLIPGKVLKRAIY